MKKVLYLFVVFLFLAISYSCQTIIRDESSDHSQIIDSSPKNVLFESNNIELSIGENKALGYQVYPGESIYGEIVFRSSNTNVVSIEGIVVTGVGEGTSVITAYYNDISLGQCVIKVSHILPNRIWLANERIDGKIGRIIDVEVNCYPLNVTDKDYSFFIENQDVACFRDGYIWGIGEGTTTIRIVHNSTGLSIDSFIDVTPVLAESMKITTDSKLSIGGSLPLTVLFTPEDTTDQSVKWKTSNKKIGKIEDGILYGQKLGTVTITAISESGLTAEKTIEVIPILPNRVVLSCDKGSSYVVGDKVSINAEIYPENTTDKTITWISTDDSIASVNSKGTVDCKKPGRATITAVLSNGIRQTFLITINPAEVIGENGFILSPKGWKVAPVTIHASKTESCYVYFQHDTNPDNDFSLFVNAGTTVEVNAPVGKYHMYYAAGTKWYGVDYRFGVGTTYYKADSVFEFYYSGDYVYGTEVTLYKVTGGNLETERINESDFPG